MVSRHILLADDHEGILRAQAILLQRLGYRVTTATSPVEVRRLLDDGWFDVLVLDWRLNDNDNEDDHSGYEIASDVRYESIPRIMWSSFATFQLARKAMGLNNDSRRAAADFVDKSAGPEELAKAIERVLSRQHGTNQTLKIDWRERSDSFTALALYLASDPTGEWLTTRAEELEALFRRLFAAEEHIAIGRRCWRRAERLALAVFAYRPGEANREYLVTLGSPNAIDTEAAGRRRAPQAAAASGNAVLDRSVKTLRFAANCYVLAEARLEGMISWGEWYSQSNQRAMLNSLRELAGRSLSPWHAERVFAGTDEDIDGWLRIRLRLPQPTALATALADRLDWMVNATTTMRPALATIRLEDSMLVVQPPNRHTYAVPDPAAWLSQPQPLVVRDQVCLTYSPGGREPSGLSADAVLVEPNGHTWLTDFGDVAEGVLVADFAALEATLRYELQPPDELPRPEEWGDYNEFDDALAQPATLDARLESPPSLRKAAQAIQQVRRLAVEACGDNTVDLYYRALFYHLAVRLLDRPVGDHPTPNELRVLICLALSLGRLAARLEELATTDEAQPPDAPRLTYHEAADDFYMGDRRLDLAERPHSVLRYLWQHRARWCKAEEIEREVLGDRYENYVSVLASQIRKGMGDIPPFRYLINHRQKGYRLHPSGQSPSADESL